MTLMTILLGVKTSDAFGNKGRENRMKPILPALTKYPQIELILLWVLQHEVEAIKYGEGT